MPLTLASDGPKAIGEEALRIVTLFLSSFLSLFFPSLFLLSPFVPHSLRFFPSPLSLSLFSFRPNHLFFSLLFIPFFIHFSLSFSLPTTLSLHSFPPPPLPVRGLDTHVLHSLLSWSVSRRGFITGALCGALSAERVAAEGSQLIIRG